MLRTHNILNTRSQTFRIVNMFYICKQIICNLSFLPIRVCAERNLCGILALITSDNIWSTNLKNIYQFFKKKLISNNAFKYKYIISKNKTWKIITLDQIRYCSCDVKNYVSGVVYLENISEEWRTLLLFKKTVSTYLWTMLLKNQNKRYLIQAPVDGVISAFKTWITCNKRY